MSLERVSKWKRWIDDIGDDLFELWFDEIRWRQLHELAQDDESIPNADQFLVWIDALYLQAAALGVRRQSEVRDDSISLARLLREVADDPSALLGEPFCGAICQGHPSVTASVSPSADDIALAAEEDASQLRDAARSVIKYVNKGVAHRARLGVRAEALIEASAVEKASDLLRVILGHYTFALKGTIFLSGPLPDYDWMQALTVPWTNSEQITEYFRRDYAEND